MTDCDNHAATVTGAVSVVEQRMCQREAEVWWYRDLSAPTVCLTCGQTVTLPEPEELARD